MIDFETATLDVKETQLRAIFRELGGCIVAFSGGVDSALVLGITARSESLAEREYTGAVGFAATIDAYHEVIDTHELADPSYAANPANRCYFCKSELYGKLEQIAREREIPYIVDGYNRDDEGDWRPGRAAAREHGVRSPLFDAGLRKADVRELARLMGQPDIISFGGGICAISRPKISSASMRSDSAWKFNKMRCRSTGTASAVMSS